MQSTHADHGPDMTGLPSERELRAAAERRRPGRVECVSPELIPLFRMTPAAEIDHPGDAAVPLAGVAAGVVLSVPFWGALGLMLRG